jgi:hypothetical protein
MGFNSGLKGLIYVVSKSCCGSRTQREASSFIYVCWVSFLFIQLCRVKFMYFVLRDFDVPNSNCNILLRPVSTETVL